jgi:uncharacterized integral membrane protein
MLDVLHFVFSSFWVWLGSTIMLAIVAGAIATFATGLVSIFGDRRS